MYRLSPRVLYFLDMTKALFHILTKTEADAAKAKGVYLPANFASEGFIHCSYVHQVCAVAGNFYKGQQNLVLLEIDKSLLNSKVIDEDLYEAGQDFPHIYGELNWDAVKMIHNFPCLDDGSFELPSSISVTN